MEPALSLGEFKAYRKHYGEDISDFAVFESRRDLFEFQKFIRPVVEGEFLTPNVHIIESNAEDFITADGEGEEKIRNYVGTFVEELGLLNEELPESVKSQFVDELSEKVQLYSTVVSYEMSSYLEDTDVNDDEFSNGEFQVYLSQQIQEIVPELY